MCVSTFSHHIFLILTNGLSVQEIAKKLEKSESWEVNGNREVKLLKTRNEGEDPKVLNKSAKIVLKKARNELKEETRRRSSHSS